MKEKGITVTREWCD